MAEQTRTPSLTVTRTLGAVALLVIGGVHYQQYHYAFYSSIPTIGPLFLLNSIAATALGLFLLAPVRSRLGRRGKLLDQLAALAGVGVAAGGLAALLVSEQTRLFGFMEHGYRFVIVLDDRIRRRSDRDVDAVPDPHAHRATQPASDTSAERSGVLSADEPINEGPVITGNRDVVAVAMQKLYEITIPGLSMKVDFPAARHRLLADFPRCRRGARDDHARHRTDRVPR